MLKKNKKLVLLAFIVILIISLPLAIKFWRIYTSNYIDRELEKLYILPTDYSIEKILKEKIADVDVSDALDSKNNKIEDFFINPTNKKKAILKTVAKSENDIVITLYAQDSKGMPIKVYKYYVRFQGLEIPNFSGYLHPYNVDNGNITDVYLNSTVNPLFPVEDNPPDQRIYSYYKK